MKTDRLTRVNELLRREIGASLFQIMHEKQFDLAAVTVTHVIVSSDLRSARVLISIRGEPRDQRRMLGLLAQHRAEIQQQIAAKVILKYTPRLEFELDSSIEAGDRMLALLSKLEADAKAAAAEPPPEAGEERDES
jgi:ribosome-binding factor A